MSDNQGAYQQQPLESTSEGGTGAQYGILTFLLLSKQVRNVQM